MNTLSMARKKKELTPNRQLARAILEQYQPNSVEDMQNALKDLFGPMFEAMLQGEMNSHLGYSNNERGDKETPNRRNGYTKKTLKTTVGDVPIEVPQDREGTFEPVVVPKRKRDVSAIEDKVLAMYAKGMSQRNITDIIEDIYGFEISHETISVAIDDFGLMELDLDKCRDLFEVIDGRDVFFASTFSSKMQIDFLKVAWGISPVLHFLCRHSFRCRRGAVAVHRCR